MRYLCLILLGLLAAGEAWGYQEFQIWVDQQTTRNVNCALCHAHGDGPDGVKPGQIGSLDAEGLRSLEAARQAFEPGAEVESPILNAFGNKIIERLGRTGFINLRTRPEAFPEAYGLETDLDSDGIPDAQEYLDGTLATNPHHGAPLRLLLHNLRVNLGTLLLIGLATLLGLFGINNLLAWFALATADQQPSDAEHDEATHSEGGGSSNSDGTTEAK